jgi:cellulose synthase/poly-beta-1,6-N-acetylglucosamine synthase-like glycosyltransferase
MTTSTHPLVDADRASRAEPQPTGARKLLSIVVPVYNEEANVDILYNVVNETLACEAERYDLELVFTDNHSTDDTFARLAAIDSAASATMRAMPAAD